ncbi:hypothetical protein ACFSKW_28070 [Nonomuraea mangrovi]|uniref:Pyridoxamine 5'-phosphate oxidase family protein n=1 Tax=Nonomuraea mangrovi TaxID=2316207 RepID=A0ABW4T1L7_9ACTN
MRHNSDYLLDDDERIRAFVHDHPWATLLSGTPRGGLVCSHLPVGGSSISVSTNQGEVPTLPSSVRTASVRELYG